MTNLWQDIRHAGRMFAKNPGFTAIAVVSIAFGTGANVAIFSAADALLLRPLPVSRPSELVTVGSRTRFGLATASIASYPDFVDIRARSQSFDGLIAFTSRTAGISARAGATPHMRMLTLVSHDFFSVLGVEPALGRGFRPEEDRVPGRNPVVVLGYPLWQEEFGGDAGVLGRTVRISGIGFTVVGVAPDRFTGMDDRLRSSAYVPLAMWPALLNLPDTHPLADRNFRELIVKGRLKPRVTMSEARAELTTIARDLERSYPKTNTNQTLSAQTEFVVKFERRPLDSGLVVLVTILSVAVLCVACANVAGLLASRAPVRAREIALRLAIGAGRARLIRQLITESAGMALAGGLGGVALGDIGIRLMQRVHFSSDVFVAPEMRLDERALIFSLIVAMGSAVLFGLGPAIQTTRVDLASALKTTDTGTARHQSMAGRNLLVAVQIALSLVLLTVAVFTVEVFRRELLDGPGWRTTHMAKVSIATGQAGYSDAQAAQFFERAAANARRVPGVTSATVTSAMPLHSYAPVAILPEGLQLLAGQAPPEPLSNSVDEAYFETMGIPILAGRAFRPTDADGAPRVAVVNDTLARHYWPAGNALGKRFRIDNEHGPWVEIVGIAQTSKYFYLAEPLSDAVYRPFRQAPAGEMVLLA
ncbi:MAG TPA: ABC transporter permease, partial [Vicinamibacterales bacterium]|nr:ABC transporter permease [Vicinamibacterales bacterium]